MEEQMINYQKARNDAFEKIEHLFAPLKPTEVYLAREAFDIGFLCGVEAAGLRELVHGTQGLTVPVIEIILRENTRLTLRERQEVALIIKNLELT